MMNVNPIVDSSKYKVRAIIIGTNKVLVLDSDVYNCLMPPKSNWEFPSMIFTPNKQTYYVKTKCKDDEQEAWVHDLVMAYHGFHKGEDYDYLEFVGNFNELIKNTDYSSDEILYTHRPGMVGGSLTLDCRFANLRPIKDSPPGSIVQQKSEYNTKNLMFNCGKCGKPMPFSQNFGISDTKGRTLIVCRGCYNDGDPSIPSPQPEPAKYVLCKKCLRLRPHSAKFFPTYKYKGETHIRETGCRICERGRQKDIYQTSKVEVKNGQG